MTGKPELILRPSTRYPSRPWALQLRVAGPAETSYAPIGHVSYNVAYILADEGYAHFLFGDPREREVCQGCGKEIDSDVCWCGDEIDRHTGYEGHSPVPMGCECGFVDGYDWMGGREDLVRE